MPAYDALYIKRLLLHTKVYSSAGNQMAFLELNCDRHILPEASSYVWIEHHKKLHCSDSKELTNSSWKNMPFPNKEKKKIEDFTCPITDIEEYKVLTCFKHILVDHFYK